MKKIIIWAKANPFFAFVGAGAIITGVVFLVRAIMNANKNDNAPKEPEQNPEPNQRVGQIRTTTIRTVGTGATAGGVGSTGMSGGRVNAGGVAR